MVTSKEVFSELKRITAKLLRLPIEEIEGIAHTESDLKDDLGIDSVESLDLLHALEAVYQIEISDEEAARLVKISDVIDLVIEKVGGV